LWVHVLEPNFGFEPKYPDPQSGALTN